MPFGEGPAKALQYVLDLEETWDFMFENFDNYAGHIEFGEGERHWESSVMLMLFHAEKAGSAILMFLKSLTVSSTEEACWMTRVLSLSVVRYENLERFTDPSGQKSPADRRNE